MFGLFSKNEKPAPRVERSAPIKRAPVDDVEATELFNELTILREKKYTGKSNTEENNRITFLATRLDELEEQGKIPKRSTPQNLTPPTPDDEYKKAAGFENYDKRGVRA
jgi:hypothetical protein